jgi:CRP/FNR family cyclic AMP-dependent transcriptional regulator
MIQFLEKVPLFKNLKEEQLQSIFQLCTKKVYKAGTVLFQEKEIGSVFYILLSGTVKIYTSSASGEEKILTIFKPGDSFGELSLLDGEPRSASAQALEDCILLTITAANFQSLMKDNFDIALNIMRELSRRLRETNQHVYDLTFLDARTRVIKHLILMANKHGTRSGTNVHIKMQLNYDELSKMAGVTKDILTKVIREFEEREILMANSNEFTLNLAKLRQ